ncbi:hypothetical protein ANCCEY_15727 [Ancylostoma ceylanicum]|uniref:Uncharacterized protein n=1 Tax=Ancylostoma ceylanicum TaxID=53326 RepID=A0A0D6L3C5_9BILA|nr:hypothetical protein ANCCEY_15727 [Ancylostoma ceylanicum]
MNLMISKADSVCASSSPLMSSLRMKKLKRSIISATPLQLQVPQFDGRRARIWERRATLHHHFHFSSGFPKMLTQLMTILLSTTSCQRWKKLETILKS